MQNNAPPQVCLRWGIIYPVCFEGHSTPQIKQIKQIYAELTIMLCLGRVKPCPNTT